MMFPAMAGTITYPREAKEAEKEENEEKRG